MWSTLRRSENGRFHRRSSCAPVSGLLALLAIYVPASAQTPAASLYTQHCAICHDAGATTRAPGRDVLRQASPEVILQALEHGTMKSQGDALAPADRRSLAEFLSGKAFGSIAPSNAGACPNPAPSLDAAWNAPHWNGWGADLQNTRFQPAAMAGLTAADLGKLKLKWAFGFPGAIISFAQPTVVAGRVFIGSALHTVYSLDARMGCVYWSISVSAPVRSAITIAQLPQSGRFAAYFGDLRAYVYAVDAGTGEIIWKRLVEDFPNSRVTGAVKVHDGRVYVPVSIIEDSPAVNPRYECCRSRSSVVALDAATGKQIWKTLTIEDAPQKRGKNKIGAQLWGPSGASVWCSPTLDLQRNVLYVGTGDNHSHPVTRTSDAVLAMALDTGRIVWVRQLTAGDAFNVSCVHSDTTNCPAPSGPDFDIGSSPILAQLGGGKRALIVGAKSGVLTALDPDHGGDLLWRKKIGTGGPLGGIQWGPAADAENVYAALSDISLTEAPGRGYIPNPKVGGGMVALRLENGAQTWRASPPVCADRPHCSPAQSAAVTVIPGVVFSGGVDGRLRAYSTRDGSVLWEFDAEREFETVNHAAARGGAFDGPGPTIAGGMLFVSSGYGNWGGAPGNVLLAFSLDGP